jgi:hyperosmotically inducible protein
MRMSTSKKFSILFVSLLIAAGLFACEKKGSAEKVGEKIDKTVEQAKDKVQDVVKPEGPMEKTGKKIDETVESAKESVKK